MPKPLRQLVRDVRACTLCTDQLEFGVRPILQVDHRARVLIAGQAPGSKVHKSGVPFDDASGERLRDWMGVSPETFYDPSQVAILPMGFCYPGKGQSGDLAPRPVCAKTWRDDLLAGMPQIQLTLVIGQYAMKWHLAPCAKNLTDTIRTWDFSGSASIPLPHPSPRNNIWLAKNPWFSEQILPELKRRIQTALKPMNYG